MNEKISTESLMDRLVTDAKRSGPTTPWPHGLILFFALASSMVIVAIGLVVNGRALDIPTGDNAVPGWWALALAFGVFFVGTVAALRLATPGRDVGGTIRYITALLLFALVLALVGRSVPQESTWIEGMHEGWQCSVTLLLFTIAPLAMIAIALRTGAPVSPGRAGRWAAIAGVALALVALDLCCPSVHPGHLVTYHLGAAVLVTVAGTLALRRWLRW